MCAMMQKLRVSSIAIREPHYAGAPRDGQSSRRGEQQMNDIKIRILARHDRYRPELVYF